MRSEVIERRWEATATWCVERGSARRPPASRRGLAAHAASSRSTGSGASSLCHATPTRRRADLHADHAGRRGRLDASPASTRTSSCAGTRICSTTAARRTASEIVNPGSVGLPYEGERGAYLGDPRSRRRVPALGVRRRKRAGRVRARPGIRSGRQTASASLLRRTISADSATDYFESASCRVATSARRGAASGGAASASADHRAPRGRALRTPRSRCASGAISSSSSR